MELITTKNGKQCLILDGYQYRIKRNNGSIKWTCLKEKSGPCSGSVKTDFHYAVIEKTDHVCIPNPAEIEVKKVVEVCKKRSREELSVPVHKIFKEEISKIYDKGYDLVVEAPSYENVKNTLCKDRRAALGTTQNPKDSSEIVFPANNDLLLLNNQENFLRLDFYNDGKRILVFDGVGYQELLRNNIFFLDGTFKSCPKQFSQLLSIHADCGSTEYENQVYSIFFCLLPGKKESTYRSLFSELKTLCPHWKPKLMKMDFEAAMLKASQEEFPDSKISGCTFHFTQSLWRNIQSLGLTSLYKSNDEVRNIFKMCAALAYLPPEQVEDGWLIIMEDVPQDEKVLAFIDYFVNQWMDNPNIPIQMWNVLGQRHRTNNVVEGFNSKLNSMVGRKSPTVNHIV